jgi:hypothetical protein
MNAARALTLVGAVALAGCGAKSTAIGASGGVVSANGASVEVPAGALSSDVSISIAEGPAATGLPRGLVAAGPTIVLGPEGQTFSSPVTVTVPTTRAATGLYTRPGSGGDWTALSGATWDAARSVISATTTHFSQFVAVQNVPVGLSGPFTMVAFSFQPLAQPSTPDAGAPTPLPLGFSSLSASLTFDGDGGASLIGTKNVDGISQAQAGSGTASASSDGNFTLWSGNDFIGSLAADQRFVLFAPTSGTPQFSFALERGGTLSPASLNGDYGFGFYSFDRSTQQPSLPAAGAPRPQPKGFTSTLGTLHFDGDGGVTLSGQRNMDGTSSPVSGAAQYDVAPGGDFSMGGGSLFTGGVTLDGSAVVFGSQNGVPQVSIALKRAGSYSNATLNGVYGVVFYVFDGSATQPVVPAAGLPLPAPRGFSVAVGTMTFDGAGQVTLSVTKNTDGAASTQSGSGTYSVAADGTFTLNAGNTFTGTVAEGGSAIVWGSTTGNPQLAVCIRR